jgi:hypothetical protein
VRSREDRPLSVERVSLFAVRTAERDIVLCAVAILASTDADMRVERCILVSSNGVTSSHGLRD